MTVWIALLRGVNVGGHRKLPMADFRALLTDLGLENAATYIQSGNAVFWSAKSRCEILEQLKHAIMQRFGFETDIFLLAQSQLETAISNTPYDVPTADQKTVHLVFLSKPVSDQSIETLMKSATQGEAIHQDQGVLYLHTPNGYGVSGVANKLGNVLKNTGTARNLRSCIAIADLATAVQEP